MKQGTREAMVLSEVMRNHSCMVDHFNFYLGHCQDPQLRSILERQQRHNIDSTQKMMQMMQNHGLDTSQIPQPSTLSMGVGGNQAISNAPYATAMASQPQNTQSIYNTTMGTGMGTTMGTGIGTMGQETGTGIINDKVIADGMLAFHKCNAETVTRGALESAEPHLRQALTNMARNCIEMSYETYNYMHQRGWYQLPVSSPNFVSHAPMQQQPYQQSYQ